MSAFLDPLLFTHIAGGSIAILAGTMAVLVRKGGSTHVAAGRWFFGSMLVLGLTASIIALLNDDPDTPVGGMVAVYFVSTSWMAARRRNGRTGKFEIMACVAALGAAALMLQGAIAGASTPAGPGPVFAMAGLCLVAGLLDLRAIIRRTLSPRQRITRHLWRMCFAFFIATGSFFLGQQDAMPEVLRGSSALFLLTFAPIAVMAWWLARLRFPRTLAAVSIPSYPDDSLIPAAALERR